MKLLKDTVIILAILFISLFTLHHFLYESIHENATVSAESVNIRVNPEVSDDPSTVIIKLSKGDRLEFVRLTNEMSDGFAWAQVKVTLEDGSIAQGYCVYMYISLDVPSSSEETTEIVPENPS